MNDDPRIRRALAAGRLTPEQLDQCRALERDLRDQGVPITLLEILERKGLLGDAETLKLNYGQGGPVFGKYRLLGEIGRGGMGVVYRAVHPDLGTEVALKVLSSENAGEEERARFRREAQTAARLQHPNIVATHDFGEVEGRPYFTMMLVEGSTFSAVLGSDALNLYDKLKLLIQVCEAVAHAHDQGVIHRDLKPGNVLVTKDGRALVTDFGLARRVDSQSHLTVTGAIMGTPAYMAPEQARGDEVDRRADLYSLGAMLYELLAGRPPYLGPAAQVLVEILRSEPPPPRTFRKGIPRELETVCLKALSREPDRRYADAREIAADLRRFLSGDPIRAKPPSMFYRLRKGLARHRSAWIAGLVIAALLAGGGWMLRRATKRTEEAEQASRDRDAARLAAAEREAAEQLRIATALLDDGKVEAALEEFRSVVSRFPDSSAAPEAQFRIAGIHRAAGRDDQALREYAKAFRMGSGVRALLSLAEILLAQGREEVARAQFEKIVARAPDSPLADRALLGLAEIHERGDRIPEARACYRKALEGGRLDGATAARTRSRERFLASLGRVHSVASMPFALAIGDLDGDDRREIVVASFQTLIVYRWTRSGLEELYRERLLSETEYQITALACGDVDGKPGDEIVVASVLHGHSSGWIRLLRYENRSVRELARDEIGSFVGSGALVVGDPDRDGRREIFAGAGYARYQSRFYRWEDGKLLRFPFAEDLALDTGSPDAFGGWSESEITAIRFADLDADGRDEVLISTGAWTAYDLRVYDLIGDACALRHRRLLGSLGGLSTIGTSVFVAKGDLYGRRPTVFGSDSPAGIPNGFYRLGRKSEGWDQTLLDPFPVLPEAVLWPSCVQTGTIGDSPVVAVTMLWQRADDRLSQCLLYRIDGGSVEKITLNVQRASELFVPIARMADLDGDGRTEFVLGGIDLRVFSFDEETVPPVRERPTAADGVAQDLKEMRLFAEAALAFEKDALAAKDESGRIRALTGLAQSLEGDRRLDEAVAVWKRLGDTNACARISSYYFLDSPALPAALSLSSQPDQFRIEQPLLVRRDGDAFEIAAASGEVLSSRFLHRGGPLRLFARLRIHRLEWSSLFHILLVNEKDRVSLECSLSHGAGLDGSSSVQSLIFGHLRGDMQEVARQAVAPLDGRTLELDFRYDPDPARVRIRWFDVDRKQVVWDTVKPLQASFGAGPCRLRLEGSTSGGMEAAFVRLEELRLEGAEAIEIEDDARHRAHRAFAYADFPAAMQAYRDLGAPEEAIAAARLGRRTERKVDAALLRRCVRFQADGPDLVQKLLSPAEAEPILLEHARLLQKHRLFAEAEAVYRRLGESPESLLGQGESAYHLGRHRDARDRFEKAALLLPKDWRCQIYLARIAVIEGASSIALAHLNRAVELGVRNYDLLERDESLSRLSANEGFQQLLRRLREAHGKP